MLVYKAAMGMAALHEAIAIYALHFGTLKRNLLLGAEGLDFLVVFWKLFGSVLAQFEKKHFVRLESYLYKQLGSKLE